MNNKMIIDKDTHISAHFERIIHRVDSFDSERFNETSKTLVVRGRVNSIFNFIFFFLFLSLPSEWKIIKLLCLTGCFVRIWFCFNWVQFGFGAMTWSLVFIVECSAPRYNCSVEFFFFFRITWSYSPFFFLIFCLHSSLMFSCSLSIFQMKRNINETDEGQRERDTVSERRSSENCAYQNIIHMCAHGLCYHSLHENTAKHSHSYVLILSIYLFAFEFGLYGSFGWLWVTNVF